MGHGHCSWEVWQLSCAHVYNISGEEAARTPRLSAHQFPRSRWAACYSLGGRSEAWRVRCLLGVGG
ncbi:unnamed protein product [Ectocarpus sp. 4 AP-2014]